jgi:hypothetical protein
MHMAYVAKIDPSSRMKSRAETRRLCQRITLLTACLFVPVVLVRRAFLSVAGEPPISPNATVFTEAKADASAIIPYIFMG